jgi:hypothetical protein
MGVTVCLPPICCRTKELVHGKKNFLTIHLLTPLSQSSASMGSLTCEKVVGEFTGTLANETGVVVEVLVASELVDWAAYC